MKKKFMSFLMVIAITIFNFIPSIVSALNYNLTYDIPGDATGYNSYTVTSNVVTLYVGNISVDGNSTLKYLYTDKSVDAGALTEIRKILPSDYQAILPTTAGQVKVSNDNTVVVQDFFEDAGMVAINKYPDGVVSDTSSTILYNQTEFNNLVSASQTEILDEATAETNNLNGWTARKAEWENDPLNEGVAFPEEYVHAFNDETSISDYSNGFISDTNTNNGVSYIIRNGDVTEIENYTINRTVIKVVNTSANVRTKTKITSADVYLAAPAIGDKVEEILKNDGYGDYYGQSLQPTVTTTTEGISVYAYWVSGLEDLAEEPFYGTFESDKYYYAMIDFEAEEGYELPATFPDGIKVNGVAPDEIFAVYGGTYTHCIVKIKASNNTYKVLEGAEQKYKIGKDKTASFRIDADYALFASGGKVYMDGTLVDSNNYTSKSGSTIITFNEAYMNTLSAGEHKLKVVFNNNKEVETTFTVEAKVPKAGDNIALYVSLLGMSLVIGSVVFIKNKKLIRK